MSKIKAKLTAVLIAAGCCATCIGVGASMKQADKVVANAEATALETEFTNNGQFTYSKAANGSSTFAVKDGASITESTLPAGYSGAVLQLKVKPDETDGWDHIKLDFSASKILAADVENIVVRVWVDNFQSGNDEIRTISTDGKSTQRQYGVGAYDLSTWCDVPLSTSTLTDMTDENGYLSSIDFGIRDKNGASHLYIDSVTVNMVAYTTDVNLGKVSLYGNSLSSPATNRLYLKPANGVMLDLKDVDFEYASGTGFVINDTQYKVSFRQRDKAYLSYYPENTDGIKTAITDANTPDIITVGGTYINKANKAKYTIEDTTFIWTGSAWEPYVEWETVNVGKVDLYSNGSNETSLSRLNLKPIDQTIAWYNTNDNFIYESGTGLQVIRNGEVVFSENRQLASRNTSVTSSSNVKYFYLDISKIDIQAGDVVKYGGTFSNTTSGMKYVIEDSEVLWDGASWGKNQEYTTYNTGALTIRSNISSGKAIYAKTTETMPFKGWGNAFYLESGTGLLINGEPATMNSMQSPPEGIYFTFNQVTEVGTELTIGGTFYCPTQKLKYVIPDTKFVWNGSTWENYIEYTTYNLGKVKFQQVGGDGNRYVYLLPGTGHNVGDGWGSGWDAVFSYKDGIGITVNGAAVAATVKFPNSMFIDLGKAPQVGDILRVGGTFYNATVKKQYTVPEAAFQYDGTKWVKYVEYATYELGTLVPNNNSNGVNEAATAATALYMKREDGQAMPIVDSTWSAIFTLESGDGWKLNGNPVTTGNFVSADAGLYVSLSAVNVQPGDILTVSGSFVYEGGQTRYILTESKFIWAGTAWLKYVEPTTYNIGKLAIDGGNATSVNFRKASSESFEVKDGTWAEKLYYVGGTGITLNDTPIKMNDIKIPNNLYVGLGATAVEGDILTIGGEFYSSALKVKYVVEESKFIYNGTAWTEYIPTYELGRLSFRDLNGDNAKFPQFNNENNVEIPNDTTWAAYNCIDGVGAKLNGANVAAIKFPGLVFIEFTTAPQEGDMLVIGGTFYNEEKAQKFVIDETTFWWNGTGWQTEEYVVQYTTYTLGVMIPHANSVTNNNPRATQLYMARADGEKLPFEPAEWNTKFAFESGDGWKLNGESITLGNLVSTNAGLFIDLNSAGVKVGDVLTVSGTFTCEAENAKYVISASAFTWNGTAWEKHVEYVTYTVTQIGSTKESSATVLYLYTAVGDALPKDKGDWNTVYSFKAGSGKGLLLNGVAAPGGAVKLPGDLYVPLGTTAKAGDVVTLDGTYYNTEKQIELVFKNCELYFNGSKWIYLCTADEIVAYDKISFYDIGMGTSWNVSGSIKSDVTHFFSASEENSTNSVAMSMNYTATETATGAIGIRLRGDEWNGYYFRFIEGVVELQGVSGMRFALELNKTYNIEIAAIDLADGSGTWCYIKIDGVIMGVTVVGRTEVNEAYNTNQVSFYAEAGVYANLSDNYNVMVTYVSSSGSYSEMAKVNELYTLATGKSIETFIGWQANGELWVSGAEYGTLLGEMTFTAVEIDFTMEEGASIRVGNSADNSGLRFTSMIDYEDLSNLANYGITNVSFGTLIVPYDYLEEGQKPNVSDFTADEDILQIVSTAEEVVDGYIGYRGTIQKIYTNNYGRLFAGRGYIEFTLKGQTYVVYTKFNNDDNVRSIRQVAQAFQADTSAANGALRYADLSAERKAIVDAYALSDEINLMPYAEYANNATPVMAWNYPTLDPTNNYMNDTNKAIAQQMKDAGIKVVNLTGANLVFVNTTENIEKTRKIIKFFWSEGLYTAAFAANTGGIKDGAYGNLNCDLAVNGFPDFSECEGFIGFIAWDEPSNDQTVMNKLAAFAQEFEKKYAGTDVIFMVNLLPSYASIFQTSGGNWWDNLFGNSSTLDTAAFKAYLKQYCDTVLSQISGEKWLSLDTYPVYKDQSLADTFLFDLGALKVAALEACAHSHVVLQSSGWIEGGSDLKSRIPTEAELRMQMYAAMAFGIDSISWFTYSPSSVNGSNTYNTPVDNAGNIVDPTGYAAFKTVNNEFNAISSVYGAFDWKGVIIGRGSKTGNEDYTAYDTVKGEIGSYELTASNTKHLSSVASNQSKMNYLMGVMEDKNGNEGYVLCNYNSIEEDRTQTITLTFKTNVTEVVIYRNGVAETVSVSNKTLTVSLATGEGVIILPSKLG